MASRSRVFISKVLDIMLDLNNLKTQFDPSNFDIVQIVKILREHLNSLIKVILIIATLIIARGMYYDHRSKEQNLLNQMTQGQMKLDSIQTREAMVGNLNSFKSYLPKKINEFELTTTQIMT